MFVNFLLLVCVVGMGFLWFSLYSTVCAVNVNNERAKRILDNLEQTLFQLKEKLQQLSNNT